MHYTRIAYPMIYTRFSMVRREFIHWLGGDTQLWASSRLGCPVRLTGLAPPGISWDYRRVGLETAVIAA